MGRADLGGCRVLVVEDDYYLASDTQRLLEANGATVVGPCGNLSACFDLLAQGHPDCAMIDINLGNGPTFEIPDELRRRGIPFLFLTGYDAHSIPHDYADIPRLQKPMEKGQLVQSIERLCNMS